MRDKNYITSGAVATLLIPSHKDSEDLLISTFPFRTPVQVQQADEVVKAAGESEFGNLFEIYASRLAPLMGRIFRLLR